MLIRSYDVRQSLPRDIQDIICNHGHDVFLVAAEMSVRSDLQFTNSLKNQSITHV